MKVFLDASQIPMTVAQEKYLLRLTEQLDAVPKGSYSELPFGPMTKTEASKKIDNLSKRLENRRLRRANGICTDRLNNVRPTGQDAAG